MALSNHTIDSTKVAEEQVEAIIDGKIKYDPINCSLVFLPATRDLSNDKKILVYLTALRGWPFLLKINTPAEDASPLEITRVTGIPGGSARPLLRALADRKIIDVKKGRYQLPSHNLAVVASLLSGQSKSLVRPDGHVLISQINHKKGGKQREKHNSKNNKPTLSESFNVLLERKWFSGGKTIMQLKEKLDEMTIFPPLSQLPFHLLKACRGNELSRTKETRGKKNIWVYYQE